MPCCVTEQAGGTVGGTFGRNVSEHAFCASQREHLGNPATHVTCSNNGNLLWPAHAVCSSCDDNVTGNAIKAIVVVQE